MIETIFSIVVDTRFIHLIYYVSYDVKLEVVACRNADP